jgi:O-antigen ligase
VGRTAGSAAADAITFETMHRAISSSGMAALALTTGSAAVAVLLGLAAGALPFAGTLALGVLGLGLLVALLYRRSLRSPRLSGWPRLQAGSLKGGETGWFRDAPDDSTSDGLLRIPRLLFYLGSLTLTEAAWRPAAGLTVSEMFFLLALGATVIAALAGRPIARIPSGLVIGVSIFALGGAISSIGAASPATSVEQTLQGIYVLLLWALTGATVLRTRRQIVVALGCWTFSSALNGCAALLQVIGVSFLGTGALDGSRATGLTDHPNDLGAACAIALVPALMLATTRLPPRGRWLRAVRWCLLGFTSVGVILSASIGAMLAGLIAILVWLLAPAVRAPGRVAVVAAVAVSLAGLTLAGGAVTSPTKRFEEVTTNGVSTSSGSGTVRLKIVQQAWPRIESNPLVGTGLDPSGLSVNVIHHGAVSSYQVHGGPISVWYQAGILGLLGVVILVWTLLRGAWRNLIAGDQTDLLIGLSILAAFLAFLVNAMTTPFVLQQYGWFSAVMLVAWRLRREDVLEIAPSQAGRRGPPPLRANAPPALAPG